MWTSHLAARAAALQSRLAPAAFCPLKRRRRRAGELDPMLCTARARTARASLAIAVLLGLGAHATGQALVRDSSGQGHHGIAQGGITVGVPGAPGFGTAFQFDGQSGSFVEVSPNQNLLPTRITVSAWVKLGAASCIGFNACAVVSNEGNPGGEFGYGLRVFPASSSVAGTAQWCIGGVGGPGNCAYSAPGEVVTGVWTHLVGTYDSATGEAKVYVNGVATGTGNPAFLPPGTGFNTTQSLYIGRVPYTFGPLSWNGTIDDVRIYDRVLAPAEIQNPPNTGTIGWWKLNEPTVGVEYCSPAVPNSTGAAARMSATGSAEVAQNDLTLEASSLPSSSFGYFLTSATQGLVVNPGGTQGNLCLAGAIGRYFRPGQIMNSGSAGVISLAVDLNQHPTPVGFVAVQPGQTWNFTAWYRDAVAGNATSNFADGLEITFY